MFQVSWLKRVGEEKEPHLLTFGRQTYSSDARFQIIYEKPNNWKLQIQFTKKSDVGLYECMVSIFMKKQYLFTFNLLKGTSHILVLKHIFQ